MDAFVKRLIRGIDHRLNYGLECLRHRVDLADEVNGKRGETFVDRERGRAAAGGLAAGATVALAAGATGAFGLGMAVSSEEKHGYRLLGTKQKSYD